MSSSRGYRRFATAVNSPGLTIAHTLNMTTISISEPDPSAPLRSQLDLPRPPSNARWGAVIAGVFVTASLWLVLNLFGMGVGLTAIDPGDTNSLRGLGIGAGIWSLIAPILALFVGGLVVSRLYPTPNRVNRAIHGVLVWSVSSLAALAMILLVASNIVQGVASTGAKVTSTAADIAKTAADAVDGGTLKSLGVDSDDLLGPINQRLRADGKPEVTGAQLEAAAKGALSSAVRTGRVDRQVLVDALARNTALTPTDVDGIASAIESRWNEAKQRASELADRARRAGLQAAEATGKALMGLSIALMLGLLASVGGSLLTGQHDRRRIRTEDAER